MAWLAARAILSVEDFVRLSARLSGRSTLDPEVAAIYLKALLTVPGNGPLLAELAGGGLTRAQMTPAHLAVEEEILTAGYTGTYRANGTTHLATHTGALVWSAIGRPAPGTCVGPTGSWSQPPAAR